MHDSAGVPIMPGLVEEKNRRANVIVARSDFKLQERFSSVFATCNVFFLIVSLYVGTVTRNRRGNLHAIQN